MNLTNYIEFFNISFDECSQVVFLLDPATKKMLACNKSGLDLCGYTLEEITNLPISKINVLPENIINQRINDVLEGRLNRFEFTYETKKNELFKVDVKVNKFQLEEKSYLLVFVDQEKILNNFEFEEHEYYLLDTLINSTDVGIMLIERNSHIVRYVNNTALSMMKAQSQEVIGNKCQKFVCPNEENCCPITELCQKIQNDEKELICSDGSRVPILKSVNTIKINNIEYLVESFVDISEKIQFQNKLKESEVNFRTFFDSMDDIIVVADLNGFLITHNETIHTKLGYDGDEVIGKHILDLHQPEKAEEAKQILDDMFAGIRDFCPLPLRKKDGSLLPVETRVWKGKWNGQDCLYGISKDISKQQSALEKFERLFKNNPAIMALSNLENGTYLDVNDSFTKILGFSRQEIIGKNSVELGLFKNLEQRTNILRKILKYGSFSNEIVEINDRDGNTKYGNFSGEVIDNQGEKILLTVMIDVTREVNQKQEIESFFSVSLDLLCITDLEGKLLKINNAWSEFLNIPKEQIVGSNFISYLYVDEVEEFYNTLKVLQKGKAIFSYINRLNSQAVGGERYFEWRAIPVGNKIYAAGRDITERIIHEIEINNLLKQVIESKDIIEATLNQKNALIDEIELSKRKLEENINEKNSLITKLEETKLLLEHNIEEKEKFFSIIAHDLKSPFSGFLGLTKVLSEEIYDLSMREMQEFASSLKQSADNLYKLLENLLEWSRVKRGLVVFNPHSIKLNDVINENIEIIKSKASLKDITLNNYIKDYINVYADENMLNAVVRNLLANSLKFTPHHGKIIIDAMVDEHKVLVSVQDTGIGMPPEILSKLFTVGEKVSRPGTDGEPSTGLGLALCKEYIDMHHGKIWAESHLNHGSTFYFSLKIK